MNDEPNLETRVECPDCSTFMRLRYSRHIPFLVCPDCNESVRVLKSLWQLDAEDLADSGEEICDYY